MAKKSTIRRSAAVVAAATADYLKPELTVNQIAKKHKVSTATLTVWAKRQGLPLRTRGRWRQDAPNAEQREIIRMAGSMTYEQVGKHFLKHKQSIHRIVRRWRDWAAPKTAPYAPGDLLLWRNKRLTVLSANRQEGIVADDKCMVYRNFSWTGTRVPKKIGTNPTHPLLQSKAKKQAS